MNGLKGWKIDLDPDDRPVFPPNVVMEVKALACELPFDSGIPLSRFSTAEIAVEVIRRGIVAQISGSTIWRWLSENASHGRTAGYLAAPAQISACGTTAPSSSTVLASA